MKAALPLLMLLSACGGSDVTATTNMVADATPVAASDAGQGATYVCTDGRAVRAVFIDPETVTLHIGDETVDMRAAVAANGARYIGQGWQWWTHGLQVASLARLGPDGRPTSSRGVQCHVP